MRQGLFTNPTKIEPQDEAFVAEAVVGPTNRAKGGQDGHRSHRNQPKGEAKMVTDPVETDPREKPKDCRLS